MADNLTMIAGATGYVGRMLTDALESRGVPVRCVSRNPLPLRSVCAPETELQAADVLDPDAMFRACDGVKTVYYLIHMMHSDRFEELDREAAENMVAAAEAAGVERVIYLGGLGRDDESLSPHLRSRHEVGDILRRSDAFQTVEFRAAAVLGSGSLSFRLVQTLTQRLPMMLCPSWVRTKTQPVAVSSIVDYLLAARTMQFEGDPIFEVGGSEVVSYRDMIVEYARLTGRKRLLIPVPLLTPSLSSKWLGLVTPAQAQVARHLIESLTNSTVVTDDTALTTFDVVPKSLREGMREAIAASPDARKLRG